MRKALAGLLVVFVVCGLCSCGGGGGGGDSASSNAPTALALKTSQIRTFAAGDRFTYAVTGTYSTGGQSYAATGTETYQVMSSTVTSPGNVACLDLYDTITLTLTGVANPISVADHSFGLQSSNGSINYYGENDGNGNIWVTSPAQGYYTGLVSPIALNATYSSAVTYSDGSTYTETYSVASSTASVTVSSGALTRHMF